MFPEPRIGLDELVMWLTVTDVAGGVTRRVDPGLMSAARLAPIVHNLAAAVTWGEWQVAERRYLSEESMAALTTRHTKPVTVPHEPLTAIA